MYEGVLPWSRLTLEQRTAIARAEFGPQSDINIDALVMASGWKKTQAAGLRSLSVIGRMLNDVPVEEALPLKMFEGTRFHQEMAALLDGSAGQQTDYYGAELVRLGMTRRSSPLDYLLEMSKPAARRALHGQLIPLPHEEDDEDETMDSVALTASSHHLIARRWHWRDLFAGRQVRAVQADVYAFFESTDFLSEDLVIDRCLVLLRLPRVRQTIRESGSIALMMALRLIEIVVKEELTSGRHHIYRGVLGIQGIELLRVHHEIMRRNLAARYCTPEQSATERAELRSAISSAG